MHSKEDFRAAAAAQGLIFTPADGEDGRRHIFELSYETICGKDDLNKIKALVELSCRYFLLAQHGETRQLLALVANRQELEEFVAGTRNALTWRNDENAKQTGDLITLEQWLCEQGQVPEQDVRRQFRTAAAAAGLILSDDVSWKPETGSCHSFCLPAGTLVVKADVETVMALVELAAKFYQYVLIGELGDLLSLATNPDILEEMEAGQESTILWFRTGPRTAQHKISLRDWLTSKGCTVPKAKANFELLISSFDGKQPPPLLRITGGCGGLSQADREQLGFGALSSQVDLEQFGSGALTPYHLGRSSGVFEIGQRLFPDSLLARDFSILPNDFGLNHAGICHPDSRDRLHVILQDDGQKPDA